MKVTVKLNKDDIAAIIAEHFGVSTDKVQVDAEGRTVGYYMNEHTEYTASATVEMEIAGLQPTDKARARS